MSDELRISAADEIRARILEFEREVFGISFGAVDTAPAWADGWVEYLLNGTVPEPEDKPVIQLLN